MNRKQTQLKLCFGPNDVPQKTVSVCQDASNLNFAGALLFNENMHLRSMEIGILPRKIAEGFPGANVSF